MNWENILILFFWSLAESIIYPIPIAVILISLVLLNPNDWFVYGFVVTLGSVTGAVIAYFLGKKFKNIILEAKQLEGFRKFLGIKEEKIQEIQNLYNKYGSFAIVLAAVSPIPYKLVTWVSGILEYDFVKFLILSLIARGITFISISYGVSLIGEKINEFLEHYKMIGLNLVIILVLGYIIYKFFTKKP